MQLNEDLTEGIALAHDLGHTPFGHAGQDALNACMKDYGGFEHNLQSLRVVDELEQRYAEFSGLNLTFETREGILKHCSRKNAETLGELGRRFIEKQQPSLEAQLTNLADEIAYNSHDVDDGLRSGLIDVDALNEVTLFHEQYETVCRLYPDLPPRRIIHEIVRRLIGCQVIDLIETSTERLEQAAPADLDAVRNHGGMLIGFSDAMGEKNLELKRFLRSNLYRHYRVHRMSTKAAQTITAMFEAFFEDLRLMPDEARQHVAALEATTGEYGRARAVADYIAGMTDRYALDPLLQNLVNTCRSGSNPRFFSGIFCTSLTIYAYLHANPAAGRQGPPLLPPAFTGRPARGLDADPGMGLPASTTCIYRKTCSRAGR